MPKSAMEVTPNTENLKVYILGDYGTGKSTFAASCPTPGYVFDIDNGILSYRGKDWEYDTVELSGAGWVKFEKYFREVKAAVKEGKYKTVVFDSTTSFMDLCMERAMQLDPKRSPEGGPIWNVHYMIVKNLAAPKLRELLTFNCNVILIGHWKTSTDAKTGNIISVDPLLTGDLAEKVPGYFDEVYSATTRQKGGKEEFILRTITRGYYKARSRISGLEHILPDELPNNYDAIMEYIKKAAIKK